MEAEKRSFVVTLSESELAKVVELPDGRFQVHFMNGEMAILKCHLDADQDVEWSFSDRRDHELAELSARQ